MWMSLRTRVSLCLAEIGHTEKLLSLRIDDLVKSIAKQAIEYERRLEILNNDRAEARQKERDFVQTTTYESAHREIEFKLDDVKTSQIAMKSLPSDMKVIAARLEDMLLWRSRVIGMSLSLGAVSGIVGGIITAVVANWLVKK